MPARIGSSSPFAVLRRMVEVERGEVALLLWSFAYFFCLLAGYYVLRPLRDAMGIAGGVQQLPWVFTGTFLVMLGAVPLYGALAARLPRRVFVPLVYWFFIANILLFYLLFAAGTSRVVLARAFFIWVSVFNLFVVSVFWSLMADLYSNAQARRLYGFIAAGGSAGAMAGPALTAGLAPVLGPVHLLPVSAALLALAVLCIHRLLRAVPRVGRTPVQAAGAALGGSALAGIKLVLRSPYLLGICVFIWLLTTLATLLYLEQAHIVARAFGDAASRTRAFAWMDLGVNTLTILTQLFLTGRAVAALGVPRTLALIPALVAVGFLGLALLPVFAFLAFFQIVRRAGNYAITRPAREMLFTVIDRESKYKAKNVVDTVVYRGGDALSAWLFAGLAGLGLGLGGIALVAVPLALAWLAVGLLVGRQQERLRAQPGTEPLAET